MEDLTFNANRAIAGDPIQFCETGGNWVDVHFIGRDRVRGGWFVQFRDGSSVSTSALRMKPASKWALVLNSKAEAELARKTITDATFLVVSDPQEVAGS